MWEDMLFRYMGGGGGGFYRWIQRGLSVQIMAHGNWVPLNWRAREAVREAGGVTLGVLRLLVRTWMPGVVEGMTQRDACLQLVRRVPVMNAPGGIGRYASIKGSGMFGETLVGDRATACALLWGMSRKGDVLWTHHYAGGWVHELCVGDAACQSGHTTYALFMGLGRLVKDGAVVDSHGSMWEAMLWDAWGWKDTMKLCAKHV